MESLSAYSVMSSDVLAFSCRTRRPFLLLRNFSQDHGVVLESARGVAPAPVCKRVSALSGYKTVLVILWSGSTTEHKWSWHIVMRNSQIRRIRGASMGNLCARFSLEIYKVWYPHVCAELKQERKFQHSILMEVPRRAV